MDRQDDESTGEDEALARPNFWRVEVRIQGLGSVTGVTAHVDCRDDGHGRQGSCGPVLLRFDELHPPLLRASGAPGWRFDHWTSVIREPDGTTRARTGRMPDGRLYVDGFGYEDTGELESLTAWFVTAPSGHDDLSSDPR